MRNYFQLLSVILFSCFVAASHGCAAGKTVRFTPYKGDVASPERGFWNFGPEDFSKLTAGDLTALTEAGQSVVYGLVRLDAYRNAPLPQSLLDDVDRSFALLQKAGIKTFLRFAYNYPGNEREYLDAKDAPLAVVKGHIAQLAPVFKRHRDLIVVVHAGFVGAWGEAHTSSNGLDSFENKTAVMQALLAAVPAELPILWRYPPDVIAWRNAKLAGFERVGIHNDCYLSSENDVGTYDDDKVLRKKQKAAIQAMSAEIYFMGETCGAQPEKIRSDCKTILKEGPAFHLSSLNGDYYRPMLDAWKAQGCFAEVAAKQGYRLRLVDAVQDGNMIRVRIINEGWARLNKPRPLYVVNAAGVSKVAIENLRDVFPGETVSFMVTAAEGGGRFCLTAPDPSDRLRADPKFNIRFANANVDDQLWDSTTGGFCFDMK